MSAAHIRRELAFSSTNGYLAAGAGIVLILGAVFLLKTGVEGAHGLSFFGGAVLMALAGVICLAGLYMLQPNESAILTLFGKYIGTDRNEGLRWAFPWYVKRRLSLRARNLNAPTLKVNDKRGNPVEISAAIVWRVRDTAQAVFEVDDFERYVSIQAEAALRHLAAQYAYDEGEDLPEGETTLRAGMDVVVDALKCELQERFEAAGVEVLDAKLTHLAYAAEIAQVMLRRQQAEAIISARAKIVHGAVSMVEAALKGLSERGIVELDDERKAAMVSNLLVVLCSDKETQPIVNTGTLYN
ncbi:SPFH domain-containing protein [Massilia endophytica]|uniref:SPFH domain-containing protein n=1 Tax=Massilia endophytica TaxID=2899220 RepID=UPI001E4CF06F|nr:SPFH domain-containing protein [Massilia endophytica]UGQ47942.1 SPFH domain-containing protein [Massilia endophytica]